MDVKEELTVTKDNDKILEQILGSNIKPGDKLHKGNYKVNLEQLIKMVRKRIIGEKGDWYEFPIS